MTGPSRQPPIRIVPASPGQRAADPTAPFAAFFAIDREAVRSEAAGLGITVRPGDTLRLLMDDGQAGALAAALTRRGLPSGALLSRFLQPEGSWRLRTRTLALDRPHIMGIVNLTEDSFSGDGLGTGVTGALRRAQELRDAGATIIDVGAESARADRPVQDEAAEAAVVGPVVNALAGEGHIVSIDTYKRAVAEAALAAGAEIVNDISGLTLGTDAARCAAAAGAGYVLNYSYSVPKRRPDAPPVYEDVVAETLAWMFERVATLRLAGLADGQIAVDPGIAFGKSHDEDIQVLRRLGELTTLGLPLLLAHSRKNFIGSINGAPPPGRDLETHVVSALAYGQGARIFRVHDAAGARRALEMAAALASRAAGAFAPDPESWPWRAGANVSHMTVASPDKRAPAGQRW
ncbi:MAG: dihydropteroate synthase [Dehalococcoidia bacterium]